jgi:allophanate hydrolase subunit 2
LFKDVGAPEHGRQDTGYSPAGPQDRFSVRTGNVLLGNPEFAPSLEMVVPPVVEFTRRCFFVLTGAKRRDARLTKTSARGTASGQEVSHGEVTHAERGDRLSFGVGEYGFRTYVCVAPWPGAPSAAGSPMGRTRGPYAGLSSWRDPGGRIRVTEGPEFRLLQDPDAVLGEPWLTTAEMSDMGLRLTPAGEAGAEFPVTSMISEPVNDGTFQWTPGGPIILLRGRQTIGGYPRVFNVIGPDVDLLAQYGPDEIVRFRKVTVEEAVAAGRAQERDLNRLRERIQTLANAP